MHQQAWRLQPPRAVGHAVHAGLGLAALLLGTSLLYAARALVAPLPLSDVLQLIVSALAGFLLWTSGPVAPAGPAGRVATTGSPRAGDHLRHDRLRDRVDHLHAPAVRELQPAVRALRSDA